MQDVRNALYANKTITISESPIQYKTWKGTGYIILDNETGAGAYLIGSGEDGGFIDYYLLFQMYMCNFKQFLGTIAGLCDKYMKKLESVSGFVALAQILKNIFSIAVRCKDSEDLQRIMTSYVLAVISVVAISGAISAIPGVGFAFLSAFVLPSLGDKVISKFDKFLTKDC